MNINAIQIWPLNKFADFFVIKCVMISCIYVRAQDIQESGLIP